MPVAGRDNRLYQRRSLYYYLQVLDRETAQEAGRLADIHVAGMLLLTRKEFAPEDKLKIRIPLDDLSLKSMSGNLDLDGVVKWCSKDVNPDNYVAGVQFVDVLPEQEEAIEEMIRIIGFKQGR